MATNPLKPISARRRLELSQLKSTAIQREIMKDDTGWKELSLRLESLVHIPDLSQRITSAHINRTIEGASTLQITVNDFDRTLLSSGIVREKLDVDIDGLWFRLTAVDKDNDDVTLTFQDREVEILRTYNKWKIAKRGDMTRAQFVLGMIKEVKEFKIPFVIPELNKVQPIEKYPGDITGVDGILNKNPGIPPDINQQDPKSGYNHRESQDKKQAGDTRLRAKNVVADPSQIAIANTIIAVGNFMKVGRKLEVVAMMVAITESVLRNNPGGPAAHNIHNIDGAEDSAGVFQQRPDWGSYIDRTTVETSARLFYNAAVIKDKELGDVDLWVLAANVQRPLAKYASRYALYRVEAERFVNAFGDTSLSLGQINAMNANLGVYGNPQGTFYFYRGLIADKRGKPIRKPENTWTCIQRLADEVDWRAFMVSGTFYFISEGSLFNQLPLATIGEFTKGIQSFSGNYDRHKKNGTIELEVVAGAWDVPPGGVVVVSGVGHPFDGRWIVVSYERDLIGSNKVANVSLKKPRPQLPEPIQDPNASTISPSWVPGVASPLPPTKDLATAILNNKNIEFTKESQTSDIRLGQIYPPVMEFMLWMAQQGFVIRISALKSDHDALTTDHNPSAHGYGKAVDIDKISGVLMAQNEMTARVMDLIALNMKQLQFDQLIGPYPDKVIPPHNYLPHVLYEHRNHIHVGWAINA